MSTLPWAAEPATVAQRIAAAVARDIVIGATEGGAPLTEAELAAAHGASRTPAREAMLQLEAWRLVRLLPKKGALVTVVTPQERRELIEVRVGFERDAVGSLTASGGGAEGWEGLAARLAAPLAAQRAALAADDRPAFSDADHAFHAELVAAGGNRVADELLGVLAPRLVRLVHLAASEAPQRLGAMLEEHERLAALAGSGDAAGFAAAVREHVEAGHFGATASR